MAIAFDENRERHTMASPLNSKSGWLSTVHVISLVLLLAVFGIYEMSFSGEFLIAVRASIYIYVFVLLLILATAASVFNSKHARYRNQVPIAWRMVWATISIIIACPILSVGRTLALGAMGSVPMFAVALLALPFLLYPTFFLASGVMSWVKFAQRKPVRLLRGSFLIGMPFVLVFTAVGVQAATWHPQWAKDVTHQEIFTSGDHGYRIPAMAVLPNDTVLAFSESRQEAMSDLLNIDIVLRRSTDGAKSWQPIQVVEDMGSRTVHNPTVLYDKKTKTVWLAFCADYTELFMTSSKDQGVTWATARNLTQELSLPVTQHCATGPGSGLQLTSGRLIVPSNLDAPRSLYSDDDGATWKLGKGMDAGEEPQFVELSDGTVCANLRNALKKPRLVTCSSDGGITWPATKNDPNLMDAGIQAAITNYQDQLLFSNPAAGYRAEMTLRKSDDNGATWSYSKLLYQGAAGCSQIGVLSDNTILVLFETGRFDLRESISLARLTIGSST